MFQLTGSGSNDLPVYTVDSGWHDDGVCFSWPVVGAMTCLCTSCIHNCTCFREKYSCMQLYQFLSSVSRREYLNAAGQLWYQNNQYDLYYHCANFSDRKYVYFQQNQPKITETFIRVFRLASSFSSLVPVLKQVRFSRGFADLRGREPASIFPIIPRLSCWM